MSNDTRAGDVPAPIIIGGVVVIAALFGAGFGLILRKPRKGSLRGLAQHYDNPDYQFYVVNPEGFVESGWEYAEDAQDQIKENAPPGRWRVIARRGMARLRVNPKDDANWLTAYAA